MPKSDGFETNAKPGEEQNDLVAIGVDIGATRIKAGFVDLQGNLRESFREDSPRSTKALEKFLSRVRSHATKPVLGIGIGCKGIIDAATTRVNCLPGDLNFLEGLALCDLAEAEGLPVCADNDARTALVGEVLWGAARGKRDVLLLTLGTGIGAAALVNGMIVRGATGAACHLGHITVDLQGGLCICGNYGCLETRFSSRAIESEYYAHIHRASPTRLSADASGRIPTTEAIFRAAAEGDPSARRVLDVSFDYLIAAVVSFLHIFDPELVIVGGNIAAAGPELLSRLKGEVSKRTHVLLGREVPILLQTAIGYGGVAGAAGLIFLRQELLTL
ncbi:MAG: ROK family protein [Candidatus Sulfotelmatobacter sp.]|jgi:glucokinase